MKILPSIYRDKEIDLRKSISEKLQEGKKIEMSIWREKSESLSNYILNKQVIKDYHKQIEDLRKELGYKDPLEGFEVEVFRDVLKSDGSTIEILIRGEKVEENEWEEIVRSPSMLALDNLMQFRKDEGKILEKDINNRIKILSQLLKQIAPLIKTELKIKNNLNNKLSNLDEKNIDLNRFEQELIYFLEKQDITEEQVRLGTHLNYFLEVMNTNSPNGKKLGFIVRNWERNQYIRSKII